MKTLYLIRHAKSDWENGNLSDIERPLNERGYRDAHAMGQKLKDKNIHPELFVSSPAIRAYTTALIFSKVFEYPANHILLQPDLYETPEKAYLRVVAGIQAQAGNLFLFAHNPSISQFAGLLTGTIFDDIPTCGVTCIELNINDWKDIKAKCGKLQFFDFPKNAAG